MEGSLLAAANIILRLVNSHYDSIKDKINTMSEPIIVPITRKGYWLFCMIYDVRQNLENGSVLNNYHIYSDRYLTKVLDGKEFHNKEVLLFDDTFETGHHMFLCYTMLTKWGANVQPIAYKCSISGREGIDLNKALEHKRKLRQYIDIASRIDEWNCINNGKLFVEKSEEEYKEEFKERISEFNTKFCSIPERYFLNEKERALFNVRQLEVFEKRTIPLIIDLPIIKDKESRERFVIIQKEKWEQLIITEDNAWKFEENIVEETLGLNINGSFLHAPKYVCDKLPEKLIINCIIKCKYVMYEEYTKVTFVPFVIMKSMTYLDLTKCFIEFFKDTAYYSDILNCVAKYGSIEDLSLVETFAVALKKHFNLYRAMYRAIVWYLSSFIGKEFINYIKEKDLTTEWDYDWDIMTQNIPHNLKKVLKKQDVLEVEKSLKCLQEDIDLAELQNIFVENLSDKFDSSDVYDYMKFKVADSKFALEDTREVLSIEEMDCLLKKNCGVFDKNDRSLFLTKIISLFQEGSCFSNALYNYSCQETVCRGFLAGENSIILLGMTMVAVFPYVYAFYIIKGRKEFINLYDEFADWLSAYFSSKEYFGNKFTRKGFEYCVNYFKTEQEDILNRKIAGNVFLMEKDPQMYKDVYFTVDRWRI